MDAKSPLRGSLLRANLHTALAGRYFRQAAEIDLADNMGNSAGGVHAGALGGLWQAAVFGFAGLGFCGERPEHRANLPSSWRSLSMRFRWRGRWHELTLPEGEGGNCRAGDDP